MLNVVRNYVGKTIQVEPDIRFEDMGINSLSAIELAERLNERFQSQLPQWVVGDYPTPQDIFSLLSLDNMGHSSSAENRLGSAETDNANDYQDELISHFEKSGLAADLYEGLISQTAVWQGKRSRAGSLLFGLNTDGLSPTIFWCCQVFYELSQLAKHLGSDQPIYGMRSAHRFSGDLDKAQFETEIKRLAKYYVSEILEIQPLGPYIIGGNCQSARISFYMALELQAQGHEIGLLCMQEHIVPIGYSGRVALFFGNESLRNPFNYFEDATVYESWSSLYAGSVSVNTITGDHGKFFTDANIQSLTEPLKTEIENLELGSSTETASALPVLKPSLPELGQRAEIHAPKRVVVAGHKKKLQIEVKVTNKSTMTWPSKSEKGIAIGYWLYVEGNLPLFCGLGKTIAEDLGPNESVVLTLDIRVPKQPDVYKIELDLLDNQVAWFRYSGSMPVKVKLDCRNNIFMLSRTKRFVLRILKRMGIAYF